MTPMTKRAKYMAAATLLILSPAAVAAGPGDVRYFGFDWMDAYDGVSVLTKKSNINNTTRTNMNVVYTLAGLNSSACNNRTCAAGFTIGDNEYYDINICPGAMNHDECIQQNSYGKIWQLVGQIKAAQNEPAAIYFIDEPYLARALKTPPTNGIQSYVAWQYPSYVCTLREAMAAHGVNWPVYSIMHYGTIGNQVATNELNNQMPLNGCKNGQKSTLDWVGIDRYTWTSAADVYNAYNSLIPANNAKGIKWVMVPPASSLAVTPFTDAVLSTRIQPYWDILYAYPQAPVIAYHVFKYEAGVLVTSNFPASKALLSFMGNTLTPH